MAIPDPVTYADINAKILEVDRELAAFGERQGAFVQDLNNMITYFVYHLRDVDVAAAIEAAAEAGEIDPAQGNAIYRKFMQVQEALSRANSDVDKIAIIRSLQKWEPVLRKLPIGDDAYNGLPPNSGDNAPLGYPDGAAPRDGADAGTGLGPPGAGFGDASFPAVPTRNPRSTISPDDMRRLAEIEEMFTQGRRPTVTTTTGKTGTVSDIFRGPDGNAIAFQVDFTSDSGITVSQRVDFPRAGGWRIRTPRRKNRKSKKVGGYKSRKSRRRTFR
jgi:hypothetical protein